MDDVIRGISEKMIRRHPHVFGTTEVQNFQEVLVNWESIKKREKKGKEWARAYLPEAFDEAKELIDVAKRRKGYV